MLGGAHLCKGPNLQPSEVTLTTTIPMKEKPKATPTQIKTINLHVSLNFIYMHKIKRVAQPIAELQKISYLGTLWACLGMPGHAHPKYGN